MRSIKTKLGVIIVLATIVGVGCVVAGSMVGLSWPIGAVIGVALALGLVQVLARGMTSPLRDMAAAAQAMASGDYSKRVRATANDEVGQLSRAFNAMASELAETDRVRRDLVANVSHELRTPISGLQAALENILDGASKADESTIRPMLAQTERLGKLVAELLDLSRLESGVIELHRERTTLLPLLERCREEVLLAWPNVNIDIHCDTPGLVVFVDGGRWRQVIINLLMNAARVSGDSRTVDVYVTNERDLVELAVCDRGPGIAEHERQRVFERFYRADAARSADGGAGLGLAIAKWIVDLHGGSIEVTENHPNGCRMVVTLAPIRS